MMNPSRSTAAAGKEAAVVAQQRSQIHDLTLQVQDLQAEVTRLRAAQHARAADFGVNQDANTRAPLILDQGAAGAGERKEGGGCEEEEEEALEGDWSPRPLASTTVPQPEPQPQPIPGDQKRKHNTQRIVGGSGALRFDAIVRIQCLIRRALAQSRRFVWSHELERQLADLEAKDRGFWAFFGYLLFLSCFFAAISFQDQTAYVRHVPRSPHTPHIPHIPHIPPSYW